MALFLCSGDVLRKELLIDLAYSLDVHVYYKKLCDLPGFVLLESTDHVRGRYDIVSALPYDRLTVPADASNLPELLLTLRHALSSKPSTYTIPFQGGAIGYISYDLGAQLMGIHSKPRSVLSTMPLLNLGFYDWAIITDHHLKHTFLYAANQHSATAEQVRHILSLWNSTSNEKREFQIVDNVHALMTKEHYEYGFNEIKKALKQGRSYQVNFTQPFQAPYNGDTWAMYQQISQNNPVPFSAFLRFAEEDILSFSPERFLLADEKNVLTSPIKGTIHRADDAAKDEQLKMQLLSSAKNRAENIMIVDLLRNDLGKIARTGSVKVLSLCEAQSYNSVHHLVSTIEAQCRTDMNPLDLFLSCFPGGSITGAPKLESMRIINELELCSRGIYCGSIVYFSRHGRFDSTIAIRTLTAKNNLIHLAAGGGIVIDSDCEEEYRECYIKIKAIIDGLKEG